MAVNGFTNIVTDGLVLSLDAGNLKSYPTSGTTWTDLSKNGNNGTLTNGPTFNRDGGGSLVLNGSTQYIVKSGWINPPTNNFTISCWVTFSSNTGNRYLLSFGKDGVGTTALIAYGSWLSNQIFFELGSGVGRVVSGITPLLNTGYNIVATANGTNTRLYINGTLLGTSSQGAGSITSSPTLSLGSYIDSSGNPGFYFHSGTVSQASIYNRALSASEVLQNYNATKWRFI